MNRTNELLDLFLIAPSLRNAAALAGHAQRNPDTLDMMSEDQQGLVRNAQRMVEQSAREAGFRKAF